MTHKYLQILPAILTSLLIAFTAVPVNAQTKTTHPAPSLHEPAIDQLAAPIALYPDVLLAQLLMASTYPLDVAEAARWADRHPAPTPAAVAAQHWESSVKALLPFAPILTMLNTEKNWTRQLAGAVIKQPAALLDTIQALRERAYDNGALHPMRQWQVQQQDRIVSIQPAEERRMYVPYYDPAKVYGAAGNSPLPAEYWAAQPYAAPQNIPDGIVFSTAIMVPDRTFYNAYIDWRTSQLMTRHTLITANSISTGPDEWQHDPQYRSRKSAQEAAASDTIGTEAPPPPTSIGTASPLQPGAISTRRLRSNGM